MSRDSRDANSELDENKIRKSEDASDNSENKNKKQKDKQVVEEELSGEEENLNENESENEAQQEGSENDKKLQKKAKEENDKLISYKNEILTRLDGYKPGTSLIFVSVSPEEGENRAQKLKGDITATTSLKDFFETLYLFLDAEQGKKLRSLVAYWVLETFGMEDMENNVKADIASLVAKDADNLREYLTGTSYIRRSVLHPIFSLKYKYEGVVNSKNGNGSWRDNDEKEELREPYQIIWYPPEVSTAINFLKREMKNLNPDEKQSVAVSLPLYNQPTTFEYNDTFLAVVNEIKNNISDSQQSVVALAKTTLNEMIKTFKPGKKIPLANIYLFKEIGQQRFTKLQENINAANTIDKLIKVLYQFIKNEGGVHLKNLVAQGVLDLLVQFANPRNPRLTRNRINALVNRSKTMQHAFDSSTSSDFADLVKIIKRQEIRKKFQEKKKSNKAHSSTDENANKLDFKKFEESFVAPAVEELVIRSKYMTSPEIAVAMTLLEDIYPTELLNAELENKDDSDNQGDDQDLNNNLEEGGSGTHVINS